MLNRRNYYRLLHVQPEAPTPVIQASYRAMMQKCKMHPDLGGDHEIASLLNQAYQTLINASLRAEYDKTLTEAQLKPGIGAGKTCVFCGEPELALTALRCKTCNIPLSPVQKITAQAAHDQRSLGRFKKSGAVYYSSDPLFPCRRAECIDLTPLGMCFQTDEKIDLDTTIKIENPVMAAAARVAHCKSSSSGKGFQIGVEFITIAFSQPTSQFVDRRV